MTPWYYDPKLYLSLVGLVVSFVALWRVEVRNKEIRKQELLDRAEKAYHELWRVMTLAGEEPSVRAEATRLYRTSAGGLEARDILEPELPRWTYAGPLLPKGTVHELLRTAESKTFETHLEATRSRENLGHGTIPEPVSPELTAAAANALEELRRAIEVERGRW